MKKEAPEPMTRQQFRDAVDHRLSGLTENPWLAQRIINNETEEPKVKKRFSLGLVAALIMIFTLTVGLAENWDTVSEVLSNGIGAHPDLVTNQPERKELETLEEFVVDRYVIEQVYAPVKATVLNDAGEAVSSLSLNAVVAQVKYMYKLIGSPSSQDEEAQGDYFYSLYPDYWIEAPEGSSGLPFAPYLFNSFDFVGGSAYYFSADIYSKYYKIDFSSCRYTLNYNSEIFLNEEGKVINCTETTMPRSLGLLDESGTIPDDPRFINLSDKVTLTLNEDGELSIQYIDMPQPTRMPVSEKGPDREMNDGPTQAPPTPKPVEEGNGETEAAMNASPTAPNFQTSQYFGKGFPPIIVNTTEIDGTHTTRQIDVDDAFVAVINSEGFLAAVNFGTSRQQVQFQETFLDYIYNFQDTTLTVNTLEAPVCDVEVDGQVVTVHIHGGLMELCYENEWNRTIHRDYSSTWEPTNKRSLPSMGTAPFDFTFVLSVSTLF